MKDDESSSLAMALWISGLVIGTLLLLKLVIPSSGLL